MKKITERAFKILIPILFLKRDPEKETLKSDISFYVSLQGLVAVCVAVRVAVCVAVCVAACVAVFFSRRDRFEKETTEQSFKILIPFSITIARRGGGLGSRPKKMYGERLGDGVEYHSMKPTPRR